MSILGSIQVKMTFLKNFELWLLGIFIQSTSDRLTCINLMRSVHTNFFYNTYWNDYWMSCRCCKAVCILVWSQWSLLGRFHTQGTESQGWSVGWWWCHLDFYTWVVGSSLLQPSSDNIPWEGCNLDIFKQNNQSIFKLFANIYIIDCESI